MAESHWTGYVGMVTGIIGAIMALISNRKINRLKTLELRLDLRKAVNDIHTELPQLRDLIDKANRSRRNVAAARGMSRSGQMGIWENEIKADRTKIGEIFRRAPKVESTYDKLNVRELESELVAVHQLQGEIRTIREKYREAIRLDEEQSKQLREDERVWHPPRT